MPLARLRLVPYVHPAGSLSTAAETGDSAMRRLAWKWVAWRAQTGQITQDTAKHQRYAIGYFVDFMGNRSPQQIGESDMARWRESMTGTLAPGTIRQRWRIAYNFLEWLVDEGKIRRNPARRIPSPKGVRAVHRNLHFERARLMHDACIDNRERLILALGFQLGMRRSEIARAELGDIDIVDRSVRIVGKGGHARVVALTVEAERAIAAYTAEMNFTAGPLVRDIEGKRAITAGHIGDIWRKLAYRAGVKKRPYDGVATHSARHTAGTDVAHGNGNVVEVRDFLGHADLGTTSRYVGEVDIETQREAIEGRRYAS